MIAAIPPLLHTPSWRGSQLEKAQGHIYLYTEVKRLACIWFKLDMGTVHFQRVFF